MYCIRCGKQLADGTKYCIYCGAPTAVPKKPKEVSPEDDFTIAVPKGYVQSDASGMDATQHISFGQDLLPDPAEEYIPRGLQDEISQVIDEEWGEREQAAQTAAHEEKTEDIDDSTLLRQYVQDVMSSETKRPEEQTERAPEQPAQTQEDARAFAADIQELIAERKQKQEQTAAGQSAEEASEDTGELLQQYVKEVMAESGRDVPPLADEVEDEGYTRAIGRDEIHQAMHEYAEQPTRVVSKEEIRQAKQVEPESNEIEQTRVVSQEDIRQAKQAEPEPDEMEQTRVVSQEEIRQEKQAEPKPDEMEQTRVVSKEDIRQAKQTELEPDEMEQTRVVSQEEICQAKKTEPEPEQLVKEPLDVSSIPDIPIPTDFVATEEIQEPLQRNQIKRESELEEADDDGPEQIISGRGIAVVIIIVALLFALAVGACVMVLNGGGATDTGSGSGDVGFSYGQSDSSAKG